MAPHNDRKATLMKELADAPEGTLHGVIEPPGLGAGWSKGDPLWHMNFSLAAWRLDDGPVRRQSVVVRRDLSRDEYDEIKQGLDPYRVISVSVRFLEDNCFGKPQALFLRTVALDTPDAELLAISKELQLPVIVTDQQFGDFILDRNVHWFEASTQWGAAPIRLQLDAETKDGQLPQNALSHARKLWSAQSDWDRRARDCVLEYLLPLKNDDWLGEEEEPLSSEEFLHRIKLTSISVDPEGNIEFWYDDGDLFWGHSISANGTIQEGMEHAQMQG